MSLDKAIEHGKEHRKPYRGNETYSGACRNHGGCEWCLENRLHKFRDKHPPEAIDLFTVSGSLFSKLVDKPRQ